MVSLGITLLFLGLGMATGGGLVYKSHQNRQSAAEAGTIDAPIAGSEGVVVSDTSKDTVTDHEAAGSLIGYAMGGSSRSWGWASSPSDCSSDTYCSELPVRADPAGSAGRK